MFPINRVNNRFCRFVQIFQARFVGLSCKDDGVRVYRVANMRFRQFKLLASFGNDDLSLAMMWCTPSATKVRFVSRLYSGSPPVVFVPPVHEQGRLVPSSVQNEAVMRFPRSVLFFVGSRLYAFFNDGIWNLIGWRTSDNL